MYKNLKNVIKYPSPEANASTSPARGKVKNTGCYFLTTGSHSQKFG